MLVAKEHATTMMMPMAELMGERETPTPLLQLASRQGIKPLQYLRGGKVPVFRLAEIADEEHCLSSLRLIEHRRLAGTDFSPGMLYQEAVCQALLGERHRKAVSRQVPKSRADGSGNLVDLPIAADQLDPEETLIEREAADVVAEIYKLLKGDDEAQLTIMAIADGKKGKELRDELGIDQARFDYIMKRIRRTVAKKYPKGWPI
jgi:hypothetical protein